MDNQGPCHSPSLLDLDPHVLWIMVTFIASKEDKAALQSSCRYLRQGGMG